MTRSFGSHQRLGKKTSIILFGAFLILLAFASLVLATQVLFIKEHHPASTFQISGVDGYRPGDEVTFHLHINVSSSSPPGGNLDITNLTMLDVLPAGLTYVPGSQISEPVAASFSIVGQSLMWNWSSQVLSSGAAPPLPDSPSNIGYTASVLLNATVDANVQDNTFLVNNGFASYKEVLTGTVSSPSTSDTIIVARPVLSIVKSGPAKVEDGSSYNYTLVLTNTGHVDATGVVVTDNMPAGVTHNPPATATAGIFTTDTATQVVWTGTLGNVTGGANTVTITIPVTVNTAASFVTDSANFTSFPSDAIINDNASTFSAATTVIHPDISLTKTASESKVENGTSVTYTYNTTNTGDTSLTVSLVDDTFGTIFTGKVLTAGESNITTVTTMLTTSTTNFATATGVDQTGASVNANATATVQVIHPAIALTKTASSSKVETGSSVTYTYNVTNIGDTSLTVGLIDNQLGTIFTGKVLAAGESNITAVTTTLTTNTTNIATATGVDQTGASVSADATATVQVIHPAIALKKTASSSKVEDGSKVTYTYNVTNTGDTTLTVSLVDDTFGTIFTGKTLAAGASNITTVDEILTVNTTNFATATGVDQTGASVNANATATVQVIHPAITLTKTPSASKVENGSSVTYTYNTTNMGDTPLTVSLTDNMFGTIFTGKVLAPGASNVTTISVVLTANTTNVATATGVDQTGASVNQNATATVQVIHPAIALTKTANPSTPQTAPANFTYTYDVTNIGDVTLSGVTVYDETFNVLILGPVTLTAGQSATGTFGPVTYPTAGNFTNIANTTGTDQTGAMVTAFANATVVVLSPPPSLATRTIGFWATHTNFTEWVFDNKLGGFIPIDSSSPHFKNITTYGELFGAFYASIPKNTDGTKRPAIDQARMILLQQLVGAILNHAASGVTVPIDPVTGTDLITAGNMAYSSNNATEMLRVEGLLDTFNGSGDGIPFPPSLPPQGSATPQASQAIADKAFWNSPL